MEPGRNGQNKRKATNPCCGTSKCQSCCSPVCPDTNNRSRCPSHHSNAMRHWGSSCACSCCCCPQPPVASCHCCYPSCCSSHRGCHENRTPTKRLRCNCNPMSSSALPRQINGESCCSPNYGGDWYLKKWLNNAAFRSRNMELPLSPVCKVDRAREAKDRQSGNENRQNETKPVKRGPEPSTSKQSQQRSSSESPDSSCDTSQLFMKPKNTKTFIKKTSKAPNRNLEENSLKTDSKLKKREQLEIDGQMQGIQKNTPKLADSVIHTIDLTEVSNDDMLGAGEVDDQVSRNPATTSLSMPSTSQLEPVRNAQGRNDNTCSSSSCRKLELPVSVEKTQLTTGGILKKNPGTATSPRLPRISLIRQYNSDNFNRTCSRSSSRTLDVVRIPVNPQRIQRISLSRKCKSVKCISLINKTPVELSLNVKKIPLSIQKLFKNNPNEATSPREVTDEPSTSAAPAKSSTESTKVTSKTTVIMAAESTLLEEEETANQTNLGVSVAADETPSQNADLFEIGNQVVTESSQVSDDSDIQMTCSSRLSARQAGVRKFSGSISSPSCSGYHLNNQKNLIEASIPEGARLNTPMAAKLKLPKIPVEPEAMKDVVKPHVIPAATEESANSSINIPVVVDETSHGGPLVVDETSQESLLVVDETSQESLLVVDETSQESLLVVDETSQESLLVVDETSQESPAVVDKTSQESPAVVDETSQENPAVVDETSQESPAVVDETTQNIPAVVEYTSNEIPKAAKKNVTKLTIAVESSLLEETEMGDKTHLEASMGANKTSPQKVEVMTQKSEFSPESDYSDIPDTCPLKLPIPFSSPVKRSGGFALKLLDSDESATDDEITQIETPIEAEGALPNLPVADDGTLVEIPKDDEGTTTTITVNADKTLLKLPANAEDTQLKLPANAEDTQLKLPANAEDTQLKLPANAEEIPPLVPANDEDTQLKLPADDGDTQIELPTADEDTQLELPAADEDTQLEIPAADEDTQLELPVADEDPQLEIPAADEDTQLELPAADEDTQLEIRAANEDTQLELPAADEDTQLEIPAADEDTQLELPAADEDTQLELPAADEDPQLEIPAADEDTQLELPAADEDTQLELPAADEDTQLEIPAAAEEIPLSMPATSTTSASDIYDSENSNFSIGTTLSHASTVFFDAEAEPRENLIGGREIQDEIFRFNRIYIVDGTIVDFVPHINVESASKIVIGVCNGGCKFKFSYDSIAQLPTMAPMCNSNCSCQSHRICLECRNSGIKKDVCLQFAFEVHILIGDRILRAQVEGQEAEYFLGIEVDEFLRATDRAKEVIEQIMSLSRENRNCEYRKLTGVTRTIVEQRSGKLVPLLIETRLKDFQVASLE